MPLSVEQFIGRYQASGLDDGALNTKIQSLANAYASKLGGDASELGLKDATEFAKWLVKKGGLTTFQARQLLTSESPLLKIDSFVLRQKVDSGIFDGWYVAQDLNASGTQTKSAMLRILHQPPTPQQLANLQRYQESDSPHLMQIEGPISLKLSESGIDDTAAQTDVQTTSYMVGRLPAGRFASELLAEGCLGPKQTALVAVDLCRALEQLHHNNLIASPERIDQIWISSNDAAVLICDPFATELSGPSPLLQQLPKELAAQTKAPELFLENERPSAQSDLYAIGCLLYQLVSGKLPFADVQPAQLSKAHSNYVPKLLGDNSTNGTNSSSIPSPLQRALAHLLAKNLDVRFPSAVDVGRAFLAVVASLPADVTAPVPAARIPEDKASKEIKPTQETKQVKVPEPNKSKPSNVSDSNVPGAVKKPKEQVEKIAAAPTVAPQKRIEPSQPAAPSRETSDLQKSSDETRPQKPGQQSERRRPPKRRKKKNLVAPIVLGSLGFVLMILIVLVLLRDPNSSQRLADADPVTRPVPPSTFKGSAETSTQPNLDNKNSSTQQNEAPYQLVEDSNTLWANPNPGEPPALTMLPPGSPMFVSFRPNQIGPDGPGADLFAALKPDISEAWNGLEPRIGIPISEVERITLAINGAGAGQVTAALAVQLKAPTSITQLVEKMELDAAQTPEGATIYVADEPTADAYYFGANSSDMTSSFAIGTIEQIKEVAAVEGSEVPLPRNLNSLWNGVGNDPDFALLVSTNFLFADGRNMLQDFASQLFDPLRQMFVPDVSGLAVRMDFNPQWFGEVRFSPGGGISSAVLKKTIDDAFAALPSNTEQFLINTTPHPSWRALAIRLPAMMRALTSSGRSGVVDGNAVLNFYLPANAAPNVILGSFLAVNTPPGSNVTAAPSSQASTQAGLTTISQMLDTKMKIIFTQESLESASRAVAEQFNAYAPPGSTPLKIVLIGSDLQLEGITQNQQIRKFEHADSTLRTVLDDLVRRANPDQTATELYQDAQKLLWVVAPDPDDGSKQAIVITVRSQAAKKGWELPPEFVPPTN